MEVIVHNNGCILLANSYTSIPDVLKRNPRSAIHCSEMDPRYRSGDATGGSQETIRFPLSKFPDNCQTSECYSERRQKTGGLM